MRLIKCIAIDDEPPALRQMEDYISRVPYLRLQSVFTNALEAINYLKSNAIDLIFLDIHMEVLNGIEFMKVLKDRPRIILTTAYDSYALQAFDFDVDDYLLKPISFERFLKSTEKIFGELTKEQQFSKGEKPNKEDTDDYFFVKSEFKVERVDFKNILYIEGLKEYLGICFTNGNKILTLQSFDNILKILPSSNFIRVHKSFIVAINKIKSIQKNRIIMQDKFIPIGPKYKNAFFNYLENRNLI